MAGMIGTDASASRYAAYAVAGCVSGEANCEGYGRGAISAVAGKIATNYGDGSFVASVVSGGTVAVIGGGRFGNGARTAAFGYLFNLCVTSAGCWMQAQEHFLKAWKRNVLGLVTPDYVSLSGTALAATGQVSVNLHEGTKFASVGVVANNPGNTNFAPGWSLSIGKVVDWSDAKSVSEVLGGEGGQLSVSIPVPVPINVQLGINKSHGGSTAFEIEITGKRKAGVGWSPRQHSEEMKK